MRVTIQFHKMADLSEENRAAIEGYCLTNEEDRTAAWDARQLSFTTSRDAVEVIQSFQEEGFEPSEFALFAFSAE